MKKHHIENLTTYYTKKGRLWWVEQDDKQETFKSIEAMVEKYPELLEVEAIAHSVERRALARGPKEPVKLEDSEPEVLYKTVQCYYCNGTGVVAHMPCPNCDETGYIKLSTKGL